MLSRHEADSLPPSEVAFSSGPLPSFPFCFFSLGSKAATQCGQLLSSTLLLEEASNCFLLRQRNKSERDLGRRKVCPFMGDDVHLQPERQLPLGWSTISGVLWRLQALSTVCPPSYSPGTLCSKKKDWLRCPPSKDESPTLVACQLCDFGPMISI